MTAELGGDALRPAQGLDGHLRRPTSATLDVTSDSERRDQDEMGVQTNLSSRSGAGLRAGLPVPGHHSPTTSMVILITEGPLKLLMVVLPCCVR